MQADVVRSTVAASRHPVDSGTTVWQGLQSTLRLLSPVSSALSTLMVGRSSNRHTHVFDLELERMHAAAQKHGCTINHLLFAGVIEGITQYHSRADHKLDALRVLMPVSFRANNDATSGNQWGPVRFTAPTNIEDPIERLRAMRTILARSGQEPALEFGQSLAGAVQLLPSVLSSNIVSGMMRGVDVVITNIPGLQEDRFLGGARVDRVYAFAPTAGAALNVALVSHHGRACVGVLSDRAAIADPQGLQQLIIASVNDVISAAEKTEPTPFVEPTPPPREKAGSSRRLSAVDTTFLELESPRAPMQIGAAITLDGHGLRDDDGRLRLDLAHRHIDARLDRVPNFRRKLGPVPLGLGRPVWMDDEQFDITRHVKVTSVVQPAADHDLLDVAASLHETPLDRNHPLWEIWFVDGLADDDVGVVLKVHHALVDGVGGVELMVALFDFQPNPVADIPVYRRSKSAPSPTRRLGDAAVEQLVDPFRLARSTGRKILSSPGTVLEQAKSLASAATEVLRPAAVAPRSSFNTLIERRRVLRTVYVPLERVNAGRAPLRATVNDVVLAALAGAFRQWLPHHGDNIFDVHAAVPVSIRPDGADTDSGNHVGAVLVTLPVGEPAWERRVKLVRDRMHRLKTSHDGEGVALVLDALDHVPAPGLRAARLLSIQRMANLVVTNVTGPRQPMYFLGSEVKTIVPVVPLGPNMGIGVAVTSYRDDLTIGIFADPDLCPDISAFAAALDAQFEANL